MTRTGMMPMHPSFRAPGGVRAEDLIAYRRPEITATFLDLADVLTGEAGAGRQAPVVDEGISAPLPSMLVFQLRPA